MGEHYAAIKKNDILTQAKTWMNFENIMLSERSQSPKNKCYLITLI